MENITRREFLRRAAFTAVAGACSTAVRPYPLLAAAAAASAAEPVASAGQLAAIGEIARKTMEQHGAPGLSLAVARHGVMVYQQGFGYADRASMEAVTPASRFRIASISKPITSVALFMLIEQGRLKLDDLIFGAAGILKFDYGQAYPERVSRITLHHLLTHTGGGWENNEDDPMFRHLEMDHQELITWALREHPLQYEPGAHYAYSNFGYCILGRVVEKVTGQGYAEFVRQNVLAKCGVDDMRIGGNTLAQRAPGEVVYYGQKGAETEPYDWNVTRMDSHGGWIATAGDLVRFATHVDGFQTTPNILAANTIKTMTTATAANANYACGWCVNGIPNWWHGGSLPGTLSNMVRTHSGLCWAAITNTRASGLDLDAMMWKVVKAVPEWQA